MGGRQEHWRSSRANPRDVRLYFRLGRGRIAGVPRVLATKVALPLAARGGTVGPEDLAAQSVAPAREQSSPPQRGTPIAIVIPTRDSATLLMRAVDTLRATARDAARLDIIIVDNRSEAAETSVLLGQLQAEGVARMVPLDTPFNWSLASNVGAAASDAPVIAFVNNDIEMLSSGWDDALLEALDDERVGAVGARLLYPNRTIQHAGIAFGFGPTGAEHEGRGVPAAERGPSGRYVTSHDVAAVTGAFLCVRREHFERVGAFDAERLMVAHSDIDLCLRLREEGLVIRYCSAIEALHHEGATRGINQTREAIAWDESERADLIDRWGDALSEDPGVSPYWLRGDAPFELLREPSMREIIEHIDRSARADPWRPRRNDAVETTAHAAANRAAAGR
jgi:O-antigen biosynthesis protein